MKIEVKTEHYKESTGYHSQENCPLAMAIKDVFSQEEYIHIWVGGFTVEIGDKKYNIGEEWSHLEVSEIESNINKAKAGKKISTIVVTLKPNKKQK
jgi:hypothetical protein